MNSRFILMTLTLLSGIGTPLCGADTVGIIGGTGSPTYAGFISSEGFFPFPTGSNLPANGWINSVAINNAGLGLVGGSDNTGPAYAALVSSQGTLLQLSGGRLPANGLINSVAINNAGLGLIGGYNSTGPAYAALVSSQGALTQLSGGSLPADGAINSVALNNAGLGLIGGYNSTGPAYAALVSSQGLLLQLSGGSFPANGVIISVAINNAGVGLIGGGNRTGPVYAALVSSLGHLLQLSGGGLPADGLINSVAINNAGVGLIGGQDNAGPAYAALVSSQGALTQLSGGGLPADGQINSVAINNAGVGLIGGGYNEPPAYAALVSPQGALTQLSGGGLPANGQINSVAINNAGVGLIGGESVVGNTPYPYAALVSPLGVLTQITDGNFFSSKGIINSVALADSIVPKSFGAGNSFANSLFALTSQVFPNHMTSYSGLQKNQGLSSSARASRESFESQNTTSNFAEEIIFVSYTENSQNTSYSEASSNENKQELPAYCFWADGFGEYAHQKQQGAFPAFKNWMGGFILACDYLEIANTVIGSGFAYAHNSVHLSKNGGRANTNQEFLTFYGSWSRKNLFIQGALWGGIYQMDNKRNSPFGISSTSHIHGGLFNPHLEIGTPFYIKAEWLSLNPFVMCDWANNWQGSFKEKGAAGFNLVMKSQYVSLLRSEVGLRVLETLKRSWGEVIFQEKASYINKTPFHAGSVSTFFIGSPSSFSLEMFNGETENLGAAQLLIDFVPSNKKYPKGSFNYQGEFGPSSQSHLVSLGIEQRF